MTNWLTVLQFPQGDAAATEADKGDLAGLLAAEQDFSLSEQTRRITWTRRRGSFL